VSDEETHLALLQAIVETARAIFGAAASSIFLLDPDARELIFEAVAGEGSADLVGRRFPAQTGIAGSVLATGQPLILDDVSRDPRFGREVAESTGYMPTTLMAVPLISADEHPLGVLEVLDRRDRSRAPLEELELLERFGQQAAIGLQLLLQQRKRRATIGDPNHPAAQLQEWFSKLEGDRVDAGRQLLEALERLVVE
jgi:GAF domain-containing protein